MKQLPREEVGSKYCQAAEPLTHQEEEELWKRGVLGDHTEDVLLSIPCCVRIILLHNEVKSIGH